MAPRNAILLTPSDLARKHRAGGAWTDRGTQCMVSGSPPELAASVQCHRRAIELLSELPVDENPGYRADLGAAWINLGCALQADPSRDSLLAALDAFDRAAEVLGKLPYESDARYRHNLAAAWMNRGDAFARIGTAASLASARRMYGRAIEIAAALPLDEKPSFRILLASCWINLGSLHQRSQRMAEAVAACDCAVAALGNLPQSGHRLACHHAATAWTNRGEAFLSSAPHEAAARAVESARLALAQVEGRDLDGPVDAKLSLRALRVMARGLESLLRRGCAHNERTIALITEVAERGLELAFCSRGRDPQFFDPFVIWFFSFGSRIYGRFQPQFLAEFLDEGLLRGKAPAGSKALPELVAIARQATTGALEALGRNRLLVAGTRQTERLMDTVKELRLAAFHLDP
jgi:hypothetical protein